MGAAKNIPDQHSLLLPYQQKWEQDDARIKMMEKARQIGLTWVSAYRLIRLLAMRRQDAWVTSRDEDLALLFIEDCQYWAKLFNIAAIDMGLRLIGEEKMPARVLRLANGSRIHSLTSSPNAQAGKRGHRLLDEFALHSDQSKLWEVAYPGITWGGCLEVVSTHRGSQSLFNKLIIEAREYGNPKGISLHRVTLQDALDQGFLFKLQSKLPTDSPIQDMDEAAYFDHIRVGCVNVDSFNQEYMCKPSSDADAYISYELLDYAARPHLRSKITRLDTDNHWISIELINLIREISFDFTGTYYLGMDIARKGDLSVIWVMQCVGGMYSTALIVEMDRCKFSRQEEVLYPLLKLPQIRGACIDATGLGMQFAERGVEKYGSKIAEITMTAKWKSLASTNLLIKMQDRRVLIPDDATVKADLRSMRKTVTSHNNISFDAKRDKDGHADRYWALALVLEAISTPQLSFFEPIPC